MGIRVKDLSRSLEFYEHIGYDVVGTVPETQFGSLTMLKLPRDPFVSLELVHDPDAGTITPVGLNHLVIGMTRADFRDQTPPAARDRQASQ